MLNIEREQRREILNIFGENAKMLELHDVLPWKNASEHVIAEDIVVGEFSVENFTETDLVKHHHQLPISGAVQAIL